MKIKYQYIGIFGIIILIYILYSINITKIARIILSLNLFFLLLAISTNVLILLLLTIRWRIIVKELDADIKFTSYILLRLKGAFLGSITPGKLGDLYRAKHLTEETELSIAQSFSSVIIDRIADISALFFLSVIGLVIVSSNHDIRFLD